MTASPALGTPRDAAGGERRALLALGFGWRLEGFGFALFVSGQPAIFAAFSMTRAAGGALSLGNAAMGVTRNKVMQEEVKP